MRLVLSNLTVGFFVVDEFVCVINTLSFYHLRLFKVMEKIKESALTIEVHQVLLCLRTRPLQRVFIWFLITHDLILLLNLGFSFELEVKELLRIADNIVGLCSVDVALVAAVIKELFWLLSNRSNLLVLKV